MSKKGTIIRCKQHRPGGSLVELDNITYHFRPRPDLGAPMLHVALVEKPAHANRLLGIKEGFELFLGEDEDDVVPAAAAGPVLPAVPDDDPAAPGAGDADAPGAGAVAGADGAPGAGGHDPDLGPPPGVVPNLEDLSDAELRATFQLLNGGRAARANTSRDTLIEKVREMQAAAK